MSTLYNQRGTWYLDITFNSKRIRKSLGTNNKEIARKLAKVVEPEVIRNILIGNKPIHIQDISSTKILNKFLKANHNWKESTRQIYTERLYSYLKKGLPENPTTKAMTIRCLNKMYKWAFDNDLISKPKHLEGGNSYESRMRTFTDNELKLILNKLKPYKFQLFVRFAYYTGARRGEIACLSQENISQQFVSGKSGKRQIKLNSQARGILGQIEELWDYNPGYISQAFKKNLRRLGIKDGRFHDLRRTFGLNLIKQGVSIYEVSKLLGHSSVRTTEKHYAPLLVTEIRDFKL